MTTQRMRPGVTSSRRAPDWAAALDGFTRRNAGRPVMPEADDPKTGAHVASHGYSLMGVTYEPSAHRVGIMMGHASRPLQHLTRSVVNPDAITMSVTPTGGGETLDIRRGRGHTIAIVNYRGAELGSDLTISAPATIMRLSALAEGSSAWQAGVAGAPCGVDRGEQRSPLDEGIAAIATRAVQNEIASMSVNRSRSRRTTTRAGIVRCSQCSAPTIAPIPTPNVAPVMKLAAINSPGVRSLSHGSDPHASDPAS